MYCYTDTVWRYIAHDTVVWRYNPTLEVTHVVDQAAQANDPAAGSFILGGRSHFSSPFPFLKAFATFSSLCWIHDDIEAFRCQQEFDLHSLFVSRAAIRAISHLVNDFMSFPVGGGRYQSGALHTMGLRRYNWRPNIQWSPPAPLCNCPLTLLPLIFLQPFMCLIVFVSTAGLSVLF